jgi:hypothetical protein
MGSGGAETGGDSGSGGEGTGGDETGTGGEETGTGGSTSGGENLILNGDFSDGTTGWEGGDGPPEIEDGVACRNGGTFGWNGDGEGMDVVAGEYTFSFKMSGDGTSNVEAKLAGAFDPYEPVLVAENVEPTSELMEYSYDVAVSEDATRIGLAFITSGGYTCIDDVTFSMKPQ